ncbi:hypothetical protein MtrunA17_Chr7g0224351 [Medicago truncatula]|uniref:Uncharacterized protein n=1 Tax=Medicago truncatula TaxID=3880 RepID=A0A396H196_MEDTR|nr:hypothetical protein MtrunA17_Chr7g0224351 [Medicago truncatula]
MCSLAYNSRIRQVYQIVYQVIKCKYSIVYPHGLSFRPNNL